MIEQNGSPYGQQDPADLVLLQMQHSENFAAIQLSSAVNEQVQSCNR